MPSFEVYMNVLWLPFIALIAVLVGFMMRRSQIKKASQKIASLENEMLRNHAEILSLQKEIVRLQAGLQDSKTRVVNIKETPPAEEKGGLKERK
jgi:Tfp pilus assembly protein PilN